MHRSGRAAAPSVVVALLLGGCGYGAVPVESDPPQAGTEDVCADLLEALPDLVEDAVRRDVEPSTGYTAAWGQPPVVLRCGTPLPASYTPDAELLSLDGVGWLAVDAEGGTFFSAVDRDVVVEVAVPNAYLPDLGVLLDLAPAILATVPERALR